MLIKGRSKQPSLVLIVSFDLAESKINVFGTNQKLTQLFTSLVIKLFYTSYDEDKLKQRIKCDCYNTSGNLY